MPQIDSIRFAVRPLVCQLYERSRSPIELGSLTHSPTHCDDCIHYPLKRPIGRGRCRPPFHGTAERRGEEEKNRRESRYVGYFANSMSNRSHRIGPSLRPPSLSLSPLERPRARWWSMVARPQCNGMCQRRIPLCLPSFALFAECRERERERRTTDLPHVRRVSPLSLEGAPREGRS